MGGGLSRTYRAGCCCSGSSLGSPPPGPPPRPGGVPRLSGPGEERSDTGLQRGRARRGGGAGAALPNSPAEPPVAATATDGGQQGHGNRESHSRARASPPDAHVEPRGWSLLPHAHPHHRALLHSPALTHTHTQSGARRKQTRPRAHSHFAEPLSVEQQGQHGHSDPDQEHPSAQALHHAPERLCAQHGQRGTRALASAHTCARVPGIPARVLMGGDR